MMNILRFAFWAIVALCLITVGIANRGFVTVRAMPEFFASWFGLSPDVSIPLFIVILLSVAAGLLIGFVWEWLREHKHRAAARHNAREVRKLEGEVDRMRTDKHGARDDVMAILDGARAR